MLKIFCYFSTVLSVISCGSEPKPAAASNLSISIDAAYDLIASPSPAAITALSHMTFRQYYAETVAGATDAPITIGSYVLSGLATKLHSAAAYYGALDAAFPTIGSYFAAAGITPSAAIAKSDFMIRLRNTAAGPEALGLLGAACSKAAAGGGAGAGAGAGAAAAENLVLRPAPLPGDTQFGKAMRYIYSQPNADDSKRENGMVTMPAYIHSEVQRGYTDARGNWVTTSDGGKPSLRIEKSTSPGYSITNYNLQAIGPVPDFYAINPDTGDCFSYAEGLSVNVDNNTGEVTSALPYQVPKD